MSENTKIEWADHSWSPWRGCTKVSPGCANCYAETLSKRNPAVLGEWVKGKPRVMAKNWGDPVRWNRRGCLPICPNLCGSTVSIGSDGREECLRCDVDCVYTRPRVFPSLCDWLDDEVPIEWLARFLHLIHETPHLDWLLLTKRPGLFCRRMADVAEESSPWAILGRRWLAGEAPPNVWFGVSVEDQIRAAERIPILLQIPAVVRWLSLEPLLGPVDLAAAVKPVHACPRCTPPTDPCCPYCLGTGGVPIFHNGAIRWLVIGGESGHGARPCNVEWVRSLVKQGKEAGVPVFVKQLGANAVENDGNEETGYDGIARPLCLSDRKGGDPSEWPADLRVREFPEVKP